MTQREKRAEQAYEQYKNSDLSNLYKAYGRPSQKKLEAWNDCSKLLREYEGSDLRVITYNTFVFTAGFTFVGEDNIRRFIYITPSGYTTIRV